MTESNVDLLPVCTLLTPDEREQVDAIGEGYYRTLHRENVEELIRDLKKEPVQAILVSVSCTGLQTTRVATLVREFPRIPAVALLSEFGVRTPQAVLMLGNSGIRRVVDVRQTSGWRELRGALMADSTDNGHRALLGQLRLDLAGAPDDCLAFFEHLFLCSPKVTSVCELAQTLEVLPSTLMSRFFRSRLPAPKQYLAMARLVRAARLFENTGFSISNVSTHMNYSSPQSFGRHIRALLDMTAGQFRARYDGMGMFERFRGQLILPYVTSLRRVRPLTAPPGWPRMAEGVRSGSKIGCSHQGNHRNS